MKTIHAILATIIFAAATTGAAAQEYPKDYLGLPGDNLNLYAVMNLFQQSETLEQFEQALNSEDQMINNLDLNGDNLIDYITVSDYVDGNVHNIVLRTALSQNEEQDVAVFVVEKLSNGAVEIQLIGDEALYGSNYIVEPIYAETPNPGYTGNSTTRNVNVVTATYYDIAAWPVVRFIFRPGYIVWRSSWYWGYYPGYWRPWRVHYWHYYYGYHYHWHDYYYNHYRHWDHYRCGTYGTYYRARVRVYSPTVAMNIKNNRYRNTYSRPDQRGAGEAYYTQTAHRRASVTRTGDINSRTGNRTGTVSGRQVTERTAMTPTRTRSNVSTSEQRSSTVQRTQPVRTTTVQRSQPVRTNSVQQSQPARSSSVQRSQPLRSSSVQRSQPANNRSSMQRSSSSSHKKAAPAVRSSNSRSSSSSVQHSNPNKSRSSTVRSSKPGNSSRSSSSPSRR
jgi:hypothetical protein